MNCLLIPDIVGQEVIVIDIYNGLNVVPCLKALLNKKTNFCYVFICVILYLDIQFVLMLQNL